MPKVFLKDGDWRLAHGITVTMILWGKQCRCKVPLLIINLLCAVWLNVIALYDKSVLLMIQFIANKVSSYLLFWIPIHCIFICSNYTLLDKLRNYFKERRTIEFSLNDFPWIQRIQWIMTKSKSSMVTRGITHLATDTLPMVVIQSIFSLLPLGRYLLLLTLNRYQPTNSSGKLLFTTISRNVSIVRYRISLVTILLLDLVMIHWIRWIRRKSFRENSINRVTMRPSRPNFLCFRCVLSLFPVLIKKNNIWFVNGIHDHFSHPFFPFITHFYMLKWH